MLELAKKILPKGALSILVRARIKAKKLIVRIQDKVNIIVKLYFFPSPIFVYSPAKVGSMSIYRSLLSQYKGAVIKGHNFFQTQEEEFINDLEPRAQKRSEQVQKWSCQIVQLYKYAIIRKKKLNVITLIREPISRNVCAFFNNFERDVGIPYKQSKYSIPELLDIFLSCNTGGNYHFWVLEWFDKHIKDNFGVDVFVHPFPDVGYATYENQNIRLLVMKLETPDELKVKAVKEFLGLDKFDLFRTNTANDFEYKETYKRFKNEIRLPPQYIDRITESKFVNHFYTRDEIDKMKRTWGETTINI